MSSNSNAVTAKHGLSLNSDDTLVANKSHSFPLIFSLYRLVKYGKKLNCSVNFCSSVLMM